MISATFDCLELAAALGGEWNNGIIPDGCIKAVFTDTRETVPDSLFLALKGETFDAHNFLEKAVEQGAKVLCIEADRKDKLPAGVPAVLVKDTLRAFQHIAHVHRMKIPGLKLAALTGSCGKTSTKEALRAVFNQAYGPEHVLATEGNTNNQIGVPQNLLRLTGQHHAAVIEMGTNHPGEIEPLSATAMPHGAMIVSIGNCHLEFLHSLEGVAREKSSIFHHIDQNGPAVIPDECAGNDILRSAASAKTNRILTFGESEKADFRVKYAGGTLHGSKFELFCRSTGEHAVIEWSIPGRHQACNAAGAAALAFQFGIPFRTIAEGLANTVLPGMRMRIAEHSGSTWINDAYNANPDSMKASIEWLSEFADPAFFVPVLGDMGELGERSAAGHLAVLERLVRLFPGVKPCLVGPRMTDAAKQLGIEAECYPDSETAGRMFVPGIPAGSLVFLKASRSMRMEKMEPPEHA